jgi:UDP-2-acetamido-2-deoxy-ribo-hexuluronate aminotransferase
LHVALMALGVKAGDEVITTPFSFFATAEIIYLIGAKPVYVDIDPITYLLNPELLEAAITERTKAIIPVSLYGQCADMNAINAIAKKYAIPVIEDAAQSLGATYHGKQSCQLSEVACTSFFPSKPLGGYGDSGACFTSDDALAHKMRLIMNHGQQGRYNHVEIGVNARMDTIQAAVLLEKLAIFDAEIVARNQVADYYRAYLPDFLAPPVIAQYNTSVYAQYTVQVDQRDSVQHQLSKEGIPTAVHYPVGLHEQPVVMHMAGGATRSFPVTENAAKKVLSLPFHPYLTEQMVQTICRALHACGVVA